MIQIYNVDNTNFDYNGDAILWPEACTLDIVLNSAWELALKHPIDDEGRYRYLVENAVIKVPSFNGEQLFRIYDKEITDTSVTVNARPIFMDSADEVFLVDARPTGKNGQQALDILTAGTKYSGRSDIVKAETAYYIRKNLIEALNSDDDQSFLNRWGGEIVFDNYTVIVNGRAGGDYGVSVEYGKNLTAIDEAVNMEEVCTRIVPLAYNGYTLEGSKPWVDSPNIGKYPKIFTRDVEFSDVKLTEDAQEDEESFDTLEALRTELIRRANLMFTEDKVDTPAVSLEVSMALLQNTEEYKNYKVLEAVSLGDTVRCIHSQYKIESEARVVGMIYDCIEDKVESVTLGKFQRNYFDDLTSTFDRVESTIRPNGTIMAERVQGILNGIYTQLRLQSTVAKKVEGRAFLIEDTDPDSDLYGCMIWGTQGLQLAVQKTADGRDWDFTTAITAKGIVADAIITGILSDKLGRNYWNLDTGEFRLSSEAFKVDGQTVQDYVDGAIDEKVAQIRTLTMVLSNEFQGVATDSNGLNGNYNACTTDVTLFIGTTDITDSSVVNYTVNPGAGVVGNWNAANKQYTVSNMTVDNGYIDISASYLNLTITRRFAISKVRAGKNGEDGVSGVTYYTWLKYADTPTTGMSDSPDGKMYIGLAYNKTTPIESTDYADYSWSLIKGTDGVPGKPGTDGKTLYTWIRYADDEHGNGMSQLPEGKKYIGFAYNKETATESNDPKDYDWALIQGAQGVPGQPGSDGRTTYFHLKYAPNGHPTAEEISETPNIYIGTYVDFTAADSKDPQKYTWAKFQGTDGIPGVNGENGETSYLHIKYSNDGGSTFTANSGETPGDYIGQYVDFIEADSDKPSDYKWTLVKGEDGRTYFIQPSVSVIKQAANDAFVPQSLVFNAYYRDGKAAVNTPYSGRWIVQESVNGNTFTTSFAPDYDTPSIMVAPSRVDVKIIRATLYASGGTTNALDIQSVTIVRDIDNLTQEEVFNILTDNGKVQGIYMQDGRLYLNGQYMQIGKIADKTGKSYWDLDNGEINLSGTFSQEDKNTGYKSVEIEENRVKIYDWKKKDNHVGTLSATRNTVTDREAVSLYCTAGNRVSIGALDASGNVKHVLEYDSTDFSKTPKLINGGSGTIFSGNPGGGIVVENGVIKQFSMNGMNGTVSIGQNAPNRTLVMKNGLIVDIQ